MHRGVCVAIVLASTNAAADATQLGIWFGPRVYSSDSTLGYIEDAPFHPALQNSIAFGIRVARPFFPWLVPELELAVAPTQTDAVGGAEAADVVWLDPRLHLRIELMPEKRLKPFVVLGGGSPIAISSARQTFDSGIIGSGYVGGGIRFDSNRGFILRFDARVALVPGVGNIIAPEVDVGFGLELAVGSQRKKSTKEGIAKGADRDGDRVTDDVDACPERAEDPDGFDDRDGCPDIDNDLDRVLDVADKCASVSESYNGYADDDGCPDTVPPDVDALRGTIEGLLYAEAETAVRDSAKPSIAKIVKLMQAHPSIRVVLIGHTDDREAAAFAQGQQNPDLVTLSADLSRARAEAVKLAMIELGIGAQRIDAEGRGSDEAVSDNGTPRGRLANRRVEIKLYVPPSAPRP